MQTFAILNITPDSFSDGGRFLAPEAALAQAHKLLAGGADVLDLGGASSNVQSAPVPPDEEIARMAPVVAALRPKGVPLSIDSFSLPVQRWALSQGVAFLNDIQGFPDPEIYSDLAASAARLVVMHSVQGRGRATPVHVPPEEILPRIHRFFEARLRALTAAGVAETRLIIDPGMGFFLGSDPGASFTVLRHIASLKAAFGLPVLISVSRKSFLRRQTGRSAQDCAAASLAAELFALRQGADFIRTHDPAATRDGWIVTQALAQSCPPA